MRTTIKATNIEHTNAVDSYLLKRLAELDRVLEPKEKSELARIELGKLTKHHHSGQIFFAEITFHVKNKNFRATAKGADLYEAIDKMQAMIVREVKRHHELMRGKRKRGGREIKQVARRSSPQRGEASASDTVAVFLEAESASADTNLVHPRSRAARYCTPIKRRMVRP